MTNEYYHPKKIAFKDGTHAWVFDDEGGGRMPATSREIAFSERIIALEAQLAAVARIVERFLIHDSATPFDKAFSDDESFTDLCSIPADIPEAALQMVAQLEAGDEAEKTLSLIWGWAMQKWVDGFPYAATERVLVALTGEPEIGGEWKRMGKAYRKAKEGADG